MELAWAVAGLIAVLGASAYAVRRVTSERRRIAPGRPQEPRCSCIHFKARHPGGGRCLAIVRGPDGWMPCGCDGWNP